MEVHVENEVTLLAIFFLVIKCNHIFYTGAGGFAEITCLHKQPEANLTKTTDSNIGHLRMRIPTYFKPCSSGLNPCF